MHILSYKQLLQPEIPIDFRSLLLCFLFQTWTMLKHKNVVLGFVLGLEGQVLGLGLAV